MANVRPDDKNAGIYRKYEVTRTDGRSAPGEDHDGCAYFVLDLDHDPFAFAALQAYAEACAVSHPALAADLRRECAALASKEADRDD